MAHLQSVDLNLLTNQQKLAFWINMYNACVMHVRILPPFQCTYAVEELLCNLSLYECQGFLQYGVPSTPAKLYALLNKVHSLHISGPLIDIGFPDLNFVGSGDFEYRRQHPKRSSDRVFHSEKAIIFQQGGGKTP